MSIQNIRRYIIFLIYYLYMKLNKWKLVSVQKIKKFLTTRYPQILLILILILISILSLRINKHIISNDNYSPELNPKLSFSRYLQSPAWRGYRVLGFASESEQSDLFRSGIFIALETFLPSWLIGQFFYLLSILIGSLSIGSLTKKLIKKSKLKEYSNWAYLISGIIYFSTLWTMWLLYQNMAPYISNFAFLPLLLLCIYRYIDKEKVKNAFLLFIVSILFSSTFVIATLFIVDFIFIFLFTVFILLNKTDSFKDFLKRGLSTLGIFLITQLFWILPFIHYTLSASGDIIDSYTNRTITASVIDLETEMQTISNSARLYNRTLFDMKDDAYVFPMAEVFNSYDFYKVLGLLPGFFAVLGLIFGLIKKNYKLLFWVLIALASLFLIKVLNPPFASLFKFMQENIPLFKQVFRWPFSKLGLIYLISISILSTFGIIYFAHFLSSFVNRKFLKRFLTLSFFVLVIVFQLIYSEYLFVGHTFPKRATVSIPQEYSELGDYLKEEDSTGRIYYAPPSNNNYFREYEWGFWGSQFISYIIPNPMMDISLAIGSKVGEDAMLRISNVVRSGDKEEFLSLMHRYDVKYILFDRSIVEQGYSFDTPHKEARKLFASFKSIWESGDLTLYEVPQIERRIFTESLSPISDRDIFVKEVPRFPVLSPIDMELNDLIVKNNEISGKFEYKGYSTYMYSNITKEKLNTLPSTLEYNDDRLTITPSYPYVYGDSSIKPYRSYPGKYDYYKVGSSVFEREILMEGITIEEEFSSKPNVNGLKEEDFEKIDMIPLLLESEGKDCSGGEVVVSTYVTPQKVSSGFLLEGTSDSPCMYVPIPIDLEESNAIRVGINWENDANNYPGYCIYSEKRGKCLNSEKFLSSNSLYGDADILLNTVIKKGENISLILYTLNTSGDFTSSSIFREVSIYYAPLKKQLEATSSSDTWVFKDIFLNDRESYEVRIPIVVGQQGYLYDSSTSEYTIWQPNSGDSETEIFEVLSMDGMYQKVQDDYINQTANLFKTDPVSKYLVYWRGENISNIPSSLCLIYNQEEKCWYQDMLGSMTTSSYLNVLNSDFDSKLLNVIFSSTSHKLITENALEEFVFMKYPSDWESLQYTQQKKETYEEIEMESMFAFSNSTYYRIEKEEIEQESGNILASIPQAKSSGWVAFARDGILVKVLGKDRGVYINDWKQAWDVSNLDFDCITVIYWPNLLSYAGYFLIIGMFGYFSIKLFKKKNGKR